MSFNKAAAGTVTLAGYLLCAAGIWLGLLGSIQAIKGLMVAHAHGDSTGMGTMLSTMGLAGSVFFGGMLFLAGLGLVKRMQLARRLLIVLACLVAAETIFALFMPESGYIETAIPVVAILFIILMFLPSVKEEFARKQLMKTE